MKGFGVGSCTCVDTSPSSRQQKSSSIDLFSGVCMGTGCDMSTEISSRGSSALPVEKPVTIPLCTIGHTAKKCTL